MQKFLFLKITALFFSFAVGLASCFDPIPQEDDATPYIVNITFSKPSLTTVTKNQYMPMEIRFDRNPSGYIHNVKVEVLDDKNVVLQKLFESTVHTFQTYTYSATEVFKPTNTGVLKIKASTTDEGGKQQYTKEMTITVQ